MFTFYPATNNPDNFTGTVGGTYTTPQLSGFINEVFEHVSAPPTGATGVAYQYRKVFVRNEYSVESTETRIWLDAVEHAEQISIAFEASTNDTTTNALTEPTNVTGWQSPTNFAEGIEIGTLSVNTATGIWIRQKLEQINIADPYATFRLYAGGIID